MLPRQWLAVNPSSQQCQFIHRFVHAQTFVVRPRIVLLPLSHRFLRSVKRYKTHVLCRGKRCTLLDEFCKWETDPRDNHRPRFHAPEPVNPFLQREFSDEIFETDLKRLLHETSDFDRPRINCEPGCKTRHRCFVGGKFVEIVVATGNIRRSQRSVFNLIPGTSHRGIKAVGSARRQRSVRRCGCAFFRSTSR